MFEKILKKDKNDMTMPDIPNRIELLKEIRTNNCRELLSMDITLKVLHYDSITRPDQADQINQAIAMIKGKKKDLITGVKYIDQELNEKKNA